MSKSSNWKYIKSSPSAFAANANAPKHRSARKAPSGDVNYHSAAKKSKMK